MSINKHHFLITLVVSVFLSVLCQLCLSFLLFYLQPLHLPNKHVDSPGDSASTYEHYCLHRQPHQPHPSFCFELKSSAGAFPWFLTLVPLAPALPSVLIQTVCRLPGLGLGGWGRGGWGVIRTAASVKLLFLFPAYAIWLL